MCHSREYGVRVLKRNKKEKAFGGRDGVCERGIRGTRGKRHSGGVIVCV